MVTVSDVAREKIVEILKLGEAEGFGVRIRILGRAIDSFAYDFSLWNPDQVRADDDVIDTGPFKVIIDSETSPLIENSIVDFDVERSGFIVKNPNPVWGSNELGPRVARVLIEQVNPGIASHGGAVILVDVRDRVAYVRMLGGCQGCGLASVTLTQGVERAIKEAVPEIIAVIDVTRHAQGTNPYYASKPQG
jgi:Fe/S biogenesis protein NfuA